jgi:hypothetical protein
MHKKYILNTLLAALMIFSSFQFAGAQASAGKSFGGDDQCGSSTSTKCDVIKDGGAIVKKIYVTILTLAAMGVFCVFCYAGFLLWKGSGDPGSMKKGKELLLDTTIGFVLIGVVIGGFYTMMKLLGVDEKLLQFIKLLSDAFIPHAYAAEEGTLLPNYSGQTNIIDFFINIGRLFVSWIIYPLLIASWVWTGFSYVAAQGNPEALKKAHKRLLYAAIFAIIVLTAEGFVGALRNTVQQSVTTATQSHSTESRA